MTSTSLNKAILINRIHIEYRVKRWGTMGGGMLHILVMKADSRADQSTDGGDFRSFTTDHIDLYLDIAGSQHILSVG